MIIPVIIIRATGIVTKCLKKQLEAVPRKHSVYSLQRHVVGTSHTIRKLQLSESPTLFLLILDRIMKSVNGLRKRGIQWSMKERLEVLDYADDICLLAQRFCVRQENLKRLKEETELVGLHININNTKGVRVNTSNMQKFRLEETEIEEVGSFVYLGSVVWCQRAEEQKKM